MTQNILDFLHNCFVEIYRLGNSVYIYNDNGVQISLIEFLIALVIITIVLTALINTVRYRIGSGVSDAINDRGIFHQRTIRNEENN